jgi:filamentous hemagglutinin
MFFGPAGLILGGAASSAGVEILGQVGTTGQIDPLKAVAAAGIGALSGGVAGKVASMAGRVGLGLVGQAIAGGIAGGGIAGAGGYMVNTSSPTLTGVLEAAGTGALAGGVLGGLAGGLASAAAKIGGKLLGKIHPTPEIPEPEGSGQGTSKNPGMSQREADVAGILQAASRGKGNFDLGTATVSEANEAGESWVGQGWRWSSDHKSMVSADGLRMYRPPSAKPYSPDLVANFERIDPTTQKRMPISNGHLTIVP